MLQYNYLNYITFNNTKYLCDSSIVTPVLDHYVLVSGGGVRVSDVTWEGGIHLIT